MIAIPKKPKGKLTAKHQQHFAQRLLPVITRVARQSFYDFDPEAKEEAVAEVVAAGFIMYFSLVERGPALSEKGFGLCGQSHEAFCQLDNFSRQVRVASDRR